MKKTTSAGQDALERLAWSQLTYDEVVRRFTALYAPRFAEMVADRVAPKTTAEARISLRNVVFLDAMSKGWARKRLIDEVVKRVMDETDAARSLSTIARSRKLKREEKEREHDFQRWIEGNRKRRR